MSKVAAALGFLVLGSGASITGAGALGAFDPDYELPEKGDNGTSEPTGFKQKILEEGCVQGLFPKVQEESSPSNTINTTDVILTKEATGCLIVNWDKWPGSTTGKWQGTFRFLGAMKAENKGFIVFASADTFIENTNYQMKFKASTYAVEKKVNDGKITKKKDGEADKKIDKSNFLTANDALGVAKDKKDFGGFIASDDDGNKLESLSNDKTIDKRESYFRGYWKWNAGDDNNPVASSWSGKGAEWGTQVFTDTPLKIADAVASVKGTWKDSVIYTGVKSSAP